MARHASKPLFFAVIAVALIGAGIAGIAYFNLINQNPVTFSIEGALYKNGELVQSWVPAEGNPMSVLLNQLAIVLKGSSGDTTLALNGGDTYEMRFYPHVNATLSSVTGQSTAAVKVDVVSASCTWKGSAVQAPLIYGQADSKTVSRAIAQAQSSPYVIEGFGARSWYIGSSPDIFALSAGQSGQLVMSYTLKATLIVDGTEITSKTVTAQCTATFMNDAQAPGGAMSVTAWVTSTLVSTPLGTP